MKTRIHLLALTVAVAALTAPAAEPKTQNSKPKTDSSDSAPADDYPLTTCIVSNEPLGSMGDAVVYTHKQSGKPDRTVRFCCEGCIEDFRANPEKFLKKLDAAEAAAAAKKNSAPAKKKS